MGSVSVRSLNQWIILNLLNGLIEMNESVKKMCTCNHAEYLHRYHEDTSSHELLLKLESQKGITVVRHPDKMGVVGYHVMDRDQQQYYTYEAAFQEAEKLRAQYSKCRDCQCKIFKVDNLKYLEALSERKTS
jgi:hypothetical protein